MNLPQFPVEQCGDQETGYHEEHVHAKIATRQAQRTQVEDEDADDCQRAQTVQAMDVAVAGTADRCGRAGGRPARWGHVIPFPRANASLLTLRLVTGSAGGNTPSPCITTLTAHAHDQSLGPMVELPPPPDGGGRDPGSPHVMNIAADACPMAGRQIAQ